MALTLFILALAGWYIFGLFSLWVLFHANANWRFITRFQMVWMLILWAWAPPLMLLISIPSYLISLENRESSNYWHNKVYIKPRWKGRYNE